MSSQFERDHMLKDNKSFVKLVTTVESMRKVFEETIPAITDFVTSRNMEGMEIIADEV